MLSQHPPRPDFSPLFMCRACRYFSVPKTWARGNSGRCAELARLNLDPFVLVTGACEIEIRKWFKLEGERRFQEIMRS